jgi:hypothetical protein
VVVIALVLVVVGVGQEAFQMVSTPISQFLTIFQSILIFIIFVNLLMIVVLGIAEAIIERVTGHSATFKRGKMITMTRAEAQALQVREHERQRKQQQALVANASKRNAAESRLNSVYLLTLPVPGGPEEEFIVAPVYKIESEQTPALPDRPAVSPRLGAEMITLGDAPPAPPTAKPAALPEGTKPRRPTNPAASTEQKAPPTISAPATSTSVPATKPVAPEQVSEAMQILRGTDAPAASKSEPSVAASVDDAVATFRAKAADAGLPPAAPKDNDRATSKPAAFTPTDKPSVFGNRPTAPQKDDLDDLPAPTVKPYAPFQRPTSAFASNTDDDNDDLESLRPSATVKPSTSTSTFRPASPFDPSAPKDGDDKDKRTPPTAKPTGTSASPLNRSGSLLSADDDDEEDLGLESLRPSAVVKPSTSTFRPASPFGSNTPKQDDDEDNLDSFRSAPPAAAKPASTPPSPFNRPAAPFGPNTPKQDDEGDLDTFRSTPPATTKPTSIPASPFNRPAAPFGPNTPKQGDEDDLSTLKPPAAAKPISTPASPFNRPAAPFGPKSPQADNDEDDPGSLKPPAAKPASTPASPFNRPAAPFGPKSPQADDDEDNLDSFRSTPPAAAKPTSTPASPFKPSAPSPMSPFHRPASPFGPRTGDDKPASTPQRPAAPPSRFGSNPAAPFGSSPAKPSSPFGKSGDEESLLNRPGAPRDATDDLFEDMGTPPTKRTTGMQPIVKTGGFGTSRPVPKNPLSSSRGDDDEEEDMDDLDDLRYEDEDPRYSDDDEDSSAGDDD